MANGLLITGNRQYEHIKSVDFVVENKVLKVDFLTDGHIDIIEMNEYYFTKKVYQGMADLACHFGFDCKIMIDGVDHTLSQGGQHG